MAAEVLLQRAQIQEARAELLRRSLNCIGSPLRHFLLRFGMLRGVKIGDELKSWDVLQTARFIEDHVGQYAPVLDIGAYASEILCILKRIGYADLTGIDLNPNIVRMPYADNIRYIVSNFMHTPFEDSSFAAITSISVIEHGFNAQALLAEISRLLQPGGFFIASVDYWPDKISTEGINVFGLDWCIFSKDEILAFLEGAHKYGFSLVGDLKLSALEPTISWQGKQYTFLWFAIQKRI
ncbi:MAG: class I SAM-dependent methyltransferase [Nitrospirae bacterium]|nr:class I SAM-dependent methyltransferase [Nitrospirota bacterium]